MQSAALNYHRTSDWLAAQEAFKQQENAQKRLAELSTLTSEILAFLFTAYQREFPNNMPTEKDLNHPLTDGIGQPSKGLMQSLFLAKALELSPDDQTILRDLAHAGLSAAFNQESLRAPNSAMAQNLERVLSAHEKWDETIHDYLAPAKLDSPNKQHLTQEELGELKTHLAEAQKWAQTIKAPTYQYKNPERSHLINLLRRPVQ